MICSFSSLLYNVVMSSEHKYIETHIDCLEILREAKAVLIVPEIPESNFHPVDESTLSLFLKSFPIPFDKKYQHFVSPALIFDKVKNCYYPFFFLNTTYKNGSIYINHSVFLINPLVKAFFFDLGIEIEDENVDRDLFAFLEITKNKLTEKKILNKVEILYGLMGFSVADMLYVRAIPFLTQYAKSESYPLKYHGLFKELKDSELEKEVSKKDVGFFARLERSKKRLEGYQSEKISYVGRDAFDYVILDFLDSFIQQKQNVLIVVPQSEKEELFRFMKQERLSDFCFDYSEVNFIKALEGLKKEMPNALSSKEEIQIERFLQAEERYITFSEKKRELLQSQKIQRNERRFDFLVNYIDKIDYLPPVDVSEYTKEEFQTDYDFLTALDSCESVLDSYVTNHPYYGLTATPKEENYNIINELIFDICDGIQNLQKKIKVNHFMDDYGIAINNFEELEKYLSDLKILSEYNGFPRKYFRLDQNNSQRYALSHLKRRYQTLSSAKLMMNSFFSEDIYKEDIAKMVKDYENGFFFAKRKAKKHILSYFKLKKSNDFVTILRLMKGYIAAKIELEGLLPMYQDVYGDNVLTMNGVMEIESNIAYIKKFKEYFKDDEKFSLDHPFIKRYLKDKEFRVEMQSLGKEVSVLETDVLKKINTLIGYFLQAKRDYFKYDFSVILNHLYKLKNNSLKEFLEYAFFHEGLEKASFLLQLTVRSYIRKQRPIRNFKKEFFMSLASESYRRGTKAFQPYQKGYENAEKQYLEALSEYSDINRMIRYQSFYQRIEESVSSNPFFDIIDNEEQEIKRKNQSVALKNEQVKYLSLRYPIGVTTVDDTIFFDDESYDHVIIFDSELFNNNQLINLFRLGKDVLLLNDKSIYDMRTQGYHDTFFNRDVIYKGSFDFTILPDAFLAMLDKDFSIHGDNRYPLILSQDDKEYALMPDVVLSHEHDVRYLAEVARFLAKEENLILANLDCQEYLFGKMKQDK